MIGLDLVEVDHAGPDLSRDFAARVRTAEVLDVKSWAEIENSSFANR